MSKETDIYYCILLWDSLVVLLVIPLSSQTQTHIPDKIFKTWKQATSRKNDILLAKFLQKCPTISTPFSCVFMCGTSNFCTSGHFLGDFHDKMIVQDHPRFFQHRRKLLEPFG